MKRGFLPIGIVPGAMMLPLLVVVLAVILFIPMIAISVSPELKLLFQVGGAIMLYSWVRNYAGPGPLAFAISGILIYIFVLLLPQLGILVWAISTFFGLGLFSTVFWGLGFFRKQPQQ